MIQLRWFSAYLMFLIGIDDAAAKKIYEVFDYGV